MSHLLFQVLPQNSNETVTTPPPNRDGKPQSFPDSCTFVIKVKNEIPPPLGLVIPVVVADVAAAASNGNQAIFRFACSLFVLVGAS